MVKTRMMTRKEGSRQGRAAAQPDEEEETPPGREPSPPPPPLLLLEPASRANLPDLQGHLGERGGRHHGAAALRHRW